MLLAHLSDIHVSDPDSLIASFSDGAAQLEAVVVQLNGLDRNVDAVVITGDLTDRGHPDQYARLRELLAPLDAPIYLLAGNHDDPAALRAAFPDHPELAGDGPLRWVVDDHPLRLVAIDSTRTDHHDGCLTDDELAWLDTTLAAAPEHPSVVCLHHPPFVTGMWWMDYGGLPGTAELRTVVDRHPQVRAVLCGHVHRAVEVGWAHARVASAPALTYQSCLGLDPQVSPPLVTDLASPISLWWWQEGDLYSSTTDARLPHRTIDLRTIIPDWTDYEARCRAGGPLPRER